MSRIEPRTGNTKACPDDPHEHCWRRRQPDRLTLGTDRVIKYEADEHGLVWLSEEALSEILRLAGFKPEGEPQR